MDAEKRIPVPMKNKNAGVEATIEVGTNCLSLKIFNKANGAYISNGPVVLNDLSNMNDAIRHIFGLLLEQVPTQANDKANKSKKTGLKTKKKGK